MIAKGFHPWYGTMPACYNALSFEYEPRPYSFERFFCRTEQQDIAMATKMDEFAGEIMPTRKVTPVKRMS
jgi:hypothetical protein